VLIKGVLLEDLFAEVGGLPEEVAVGVTAKDGYEMTMSAEQVRSGDFITYDMVTGEEKTVDEPLRVIVAYEYDGKPLDPEADGPLRLFAVSSKQNQVIDGHWTVKWVTKVEVKAIVQEWTFILKGKLSEEMDRSTFESGSAEGCHGQDWTDAEGKTWRGIPLYLLVGRVDDDVAHEGPAYNRELAQAGYMVSIKTADGSTVQVSSETMYYNKALIVAYELDGEPLPQEYWPLRLVGEGVDETDMVGQIVEIEALVPVE
jgi:DMSO/TMAO reductase YedYZ molybdopterin-dependent catalytic subunit